MNAIFLEPRIGGLGIYLRRLLPGLLDARPDWRISVFVNPRGRELIAAEPWSREVELVVPPILGLRGTKAVTELAAVGSMADRRQMDVVHSVAMTGPLRARAATVVTIPDLIWLTHPDPGERFTNRLWRAVVPAVSRRADRLIVLSEATRAAVVQELGIPADRMDVVPLGRDAPTTEPAPDADIRARLGLGAGPIVLAVSAAKAHKNVVRLVQAMREVRAHHPDAVLVVPGNPTALHTELERRALAAGVEHAVRFPGWIDDRQLEGLYGACACVVVPSLVEGFGLPVLEAIARGAPVACSNTSSLPEVAGPAAVYFDPLVTSEIAAAVRRLLEQPEEAALLRQLGRARSEQFSWRRTAELTATAYERAAGSRDADGAPAAHIASPR